MTSHTTKSREKKEKQKLQTDLKCIIVNSHPSMTIFFSFLSFFIQLFYFNIFNPVSLTYFDMSSMMSSDRKKRNEISLPMVVLQMVPNVTTVAFMLYRPAGICVLFTFYNITHLHTHITVAAVQRDKMTMNETI